MLLVHLFLCLHILPLPTLSRSFCPIPTTWSANSLISLASSWKKISLCLLLLTKIWLISEGTISPDTLLIKSFFSVIILLHGQVQRQVFPLLPTASHRSFSLPLQNPHCWYYAVHLTYAFIILSPLFSWFLSALLVIATPSQRPQLHALTSQFSDISPPTAFSSISIQPHSQILSSSQTSLVQNLDSQYPTFWPYILAFPRCLLSFFHRHNFWSHWDYPHIMDWIFVPP